LTIVVSSIQGASDDEPFRPQSLEWEQACMGPEVCRTASFVSSYGEQMVGSLSCMHGGVLYHLTHDAEDCLWSVRQ
jgi:hypothetical protein